MQFVFTTDGGIAAKMEGDECKSDIATRPVDIKTNCTVSLFIEDSAGKISNHIVNCDQLVTGEEFPGSNLYYACWSCMLASIAIAFKWKASQALRFAQAQAEQQQRYDQDAEEMFADHEEQNDSGL
ncbi:unnamed protein product [Pseudo-nitzschia multistriata]|uniref:Uncharacterized protein n=1 Tax=Pseudo-nitzschia multistriata TaxID=183589 RepID=A0A448ZQ34_9STRA|nr:unnamed protein product [Pseudo-nitzschia multistriata]